MNRAGCHGIGVVVRQLFRASNAVGLSICVCDTPMPRKLCFIRFCRGAGKPGFYFASLPYVLSINGWTWSDLRSRESKLEKELKN